MSIYERLVPRRMNYILFWFLMSMVIWGLFELVMFLLNENDYRLMRFVFCLLGFGFIPVFMIFLTHGFQAATRNLDQIINFSTENYGEWIKLEAEKIFKLTTPASWLRVGLTLAMIIAISLAGGRFIFHSTPAVIILYMIAAVVFSAGIHGQYAIEKLLGFLTRIETFPIHLRFSQIDHPLLLNLFRFYSQAALQTLFAILLMVFLFWTTPFKFTPEVLIAISLVGFYPPALLVWSAFKIHLMMVKAKGEHLEIILGKIQASLKHIEADSSKATVENLQILLNVQKSIKSQIDWPINPESVTTLLFTILIPTVNFIFTVLGKFSK